MSALRATVAAVINEMSRMMPNATEDWRARLVEALGHDPSSPPDPFIDSLYRSAIAADDECLDHFGDQMREAADRLSAA